MIDGLKTLFAGLADIFKVSPDPFSESQPMPAPADAPFEYRYGYIVHGAGSPKEVGNGELTILDLETAELCEVTAYYREKDDTNGPVTLVRFKGYNQVFVAEADKETVEAAAKSRTPLVGRRFAQIDLMALLNEEGSDFRAEVLAFMEGDKARGMPLAAVPLP